MKSKTESYIDAVTEFLAKPRKVSDMSTRFYRNDNNEDEFRLEGHRFVVMEAEFSNVMTFTKSRLISVKSVELPDTDAISVTYEPDFWGRKVDMVTRVEACLKLAENFIRNMLPKVDYKFKVELHNDEIENILEVLE